MFTWVWEWYVVFISQQLFLRNSLVSSAINGSDLSVSLLACLNQAFRDCFRTSFYHLMRVASIPVIPVHPTAASPSWEILLSCMSFCFYTTDVWISSWTTAGGKLKQARKFAKNSTAKNRWYFSSSLSMKDINEICGIYWIHSIATECESFGFHRYFESGDISSTNMPILGGHYRIIMSLLLATQTNARNRSICQ